jgi:hypothetical protein
MCKSKINRGTLTGADLNYEGSLTLDPDLMDAADLLAFERVQVVNVNTGTRLETYVIPGDRSSGTIQLNGAAARSGGQKRTGASTGSLFNHTGGSTDPEAIDAAPQADEPVSPQLERLLPEAASWRVDAVTCAIGTTIGQAGSKEAFRQVDQRGDRTGHNAHRLPIAHDRSANPDRRPPRRTPPGRGHRAPPGTATRADPSKEVPRQPRPHNRRGPRQCRHCRRTRLPFSIRRKLDLTTGATP